MWCTEPVITKLRLWRILFAVSFLQSVKKQLFFFFKNKIGKCLNRSFICSTDVGGWCPLSMKCKKTRFQRSLNWFLNICQRSSRASHSETPQTLFLLSLAISLAEPVLGHNPRMSLSSRCLWSPCSVIVLCVRWWCNVWEMMQPPMRCCTETTVAS